jgi:hypothetical protein
VVRPAGLPLTRTTVATGHGGSSECSNALARQLSDLYYINSIFELSQLYILKLYPTSTSE